MTLSYRFVYIILAHGLCIVQNSTIIMYYILTVALKIVFTADKFLVAWEYRGITLNVGATGTEIIIASRLPSIILEEKHTGINFSYHQAILKLR